MSSSVKRTNVPTPEQTGTTLLMALPLGILLSFFDLLGARAFARGEVRLTVTFYHYFT